MTRCELGTVVVVTRAKNSRTKRWRRRETEEGRKGGGGVLRKTERTGIRKKSGALGSRRTVSCSFLRAEQSRRLPRWAGANGKAQAGLSGSGYEYPILQYRLPDAVSLSLSVCRRLSLCFLGYWAVGGAVGRAEQQGSRCEWPKRAREAVCYRQTAGQTASQTSNRPCCAARRSV